MREAGAVVIAEDAQGVGDALLTLLRDPDAREDMARAGCALVSNGRGALKRTVALIGPALPPPLE